MSREQLFLTGNRLRTSEGLPSYIHATAPSPERKIMDSVRPIPLPRSDLKAVEALLWNQPNEAAAEMEKLRVNEGTYSVPELNTVFMQHLALPLFKREFQGNGGDIATNIEINQVKYITPVLLERYLAIAEHGSDSEYDDTEVLQAMRDASVLQLGLRTLNGDRSDDIIILPAGPQTGTTSTTMTVLRSNSLGRVNLVITDEKRHAQTSPINHSIYISTEELTTCNDIVPLASALAIEQEGAPLDTQSAYTIEYASTQLFAKITGYFDTLPRFETTIAYPDQSI